MVRCYKDFVETLLSSGFSMGGSSSDEIYAVISFSWNEIPPCETPIRWHTGKPDTDPLGYCQEELFLTGKNPQDKA